MTLPDVEQGIARIGRQFQANGRVYEVGTIDLQGRTVNAKVLWPLHMNAQVHPFPLADVDRWIEERQRE